MPESADPERRVVEDPASPFVRDRHVEKASRESFPASDAPAWTPLAAGGTPAADLPAVPDAGGDAIAFGRALAQRLFGALEAHDVDGVLALLADDATLRIGAAPALVGHAAVREWLAAHVGPLAALRHSVTDVRAEADFVLAEAEVTVVRDDGARATAPAALSVRLRGGRIVRGQWYGDPRLWERRA